MDSAFSGPPEGGGSAYRSHRGLRALPVGNLDGRLRNRRSSPIAGFAWKHHAGPETNSQFEKSIVPCCVKERQGIFAVKGLGCLFARSEKRVRALLGLQ